MTISSSPKHLAPLPQNLINEAVASALSEDLGTLGDITTNATVPEDVTLKANIVSRQDGIVSGLAVAKAAFHAIDPALSFTTHQRDGDTISPGTIIATIEGRARGILTAERVALNFMGRMCGIATLTRRFVDAIAEQHAQIADTRKTTPGLRAFEKYAVRCGGGVNHRVGLYDAILIKDNHIAAAGSVKQAVTVAKAAAGHMIKIEVEVDTLEQLDDVLALGVDAVLLDNMSPKNLKTAVEKVAGRLITEASGGVSLETVKSISESGVDLISVGALTHSAPVLDLGLDFVE